MYQTTMKTCLVLASSICLITAATTRQIGRFTGINASGPLAVTVTLGKREEINIDTDPNLISSIETFVDKQGTLIIRIKPDLDLTNPGNIQITVTGRRIESFVTSGSCNLVVQSSLTSSSTHNIRIATYDASSLALQDGVTGYSFSAVTSGASSLSVVNMALQDVSVVVSGTSTATFKGTADTASIVVNDAAQYHGSQLDVTWLSVTAGDQSIAEVQGSKELKVSVAQHALVRTSGRGKVVKEVKDHGVIKT